MEAVLDELQRTRELAAEIVRVLDKHGVSVARNPKLLIDLVTVCKEHK